MSKRRKYILFVILLLCHAPAICTALYQPISIVKNLIGNAITTVFSDTYDTATPGGGDSPAEADDRMREIKAAVQERLNVSMYFPLTGTEVSDTHAGEMRYVPFHQSISDPTQVSGHADLYMKSDELYYQDDTNTTLQLTSAGDLNSSAGLAVTGAATIGTTLDVIGNIDPTTYETTNGGFLDEDDMASDAADKVASQQSIKAYVDDSASSISLNGTPGQAIEMYDSGWFAISVAQTTEKSHGLSGVPQIVNFLFSDASDGDGRIVHGSKLRHQTNDTMSGIAKITATKITIRTGTPTVMDYFDFAGNRQLPTTGFAKVTAIFIGP